MKRSFIYININIYCNFIIDAWNNLHSYTRLPIKEISGLICDSSIARLRVFDRFGKPKTKEDVINMLGDRSDSTYPVFRDGNAGIVKTIATGKLNRYICVDSVLWTIVFSNR